MNWREVDVRGQPPGWFCCEMPQAAWFQAAWFQAAWFQAA